MHLDVVGVGGNVAGGRRGRERSIVMKVGPYRSGAIFAGGSVERPLHLDDAEVLLCDWTASDFSSSERLAERCMAVLAF